MNEYLQMSGKKTDADQTDRVITHSGPEGFRRVVLDCRHATSEMSFSFDEPIATASNVIYLDPGDIFDEFVSKGSFSIHYKGVGIFRYQTYTKEY